MPHVVLVLVESVNDYLHMLENQGYELILAPTPASRAEAIARHGARIDAVYAAPHHAEAVDDRYRHPDHPDRKPNPGMLLRAIAEAVFTGEVESALIVQLWAGSANDPQLKSLLSEQLTGVREEIKRRLARWLEAQGEPDASARAETLALVTMGQVMGMLAARTMLPHLDRDAYLDEAAALLDGAGRVRQQLHLFFSVVCRDGWAGAAREHQSRPIGLDLRRALVDQLAIELGALRTLVRQVDRHRRQAGRQLAPAAHEYERHLLA